MLCEFGTTASQARGRYGRFLRAGIADPPASPFDDAEGGLLVGSSAFVDRVRRLLGEKPDDLDLPQLGQLRPRPALLTIRAAVAAHFDVDAADWVPGHRSNHAARAVAAYLARRRFGYPATAVAAALGYRDHGGVGQAIRRVEHGTAQLQRTVGRLEKRLLST